MKNDIVFRAETHFKKGIKKLIDGEIALLINCFKSIYHNGFKNQIVVLFELFSFFFFEDKLKNNYQNFYLIISKHYPLFKKS